MPKFSETSVSVVGESAVPFTVHYPEVGATTPLDKAAQALVDTAEHQVSPFNAKGESQNALDQHYAVTPFDKWDSMKKYNNFISKPSSLGPPLNRRLMLITLRVVQGDQYKNNQFVFVKGKVSTPREGQERDFWVARILQVRASDPEHVYALVCNIYLLSDREVIDFTGNLAILA